MAHLTTTNKIWSAWIGQRVYVRKKIPGILKYVGEIKFKRGFWCGVELDEPVGENNGIFNGVQYFKCKDNYGTFESVCEITVLMESTTEVNSVCDLLKLKCLGCRNRLTSCNELSSTYSRFCNSAKHDLGIRTSKKEAEYVDKTFNMNANKNTNAVFCSQTQREKCHTDNGMDLKVKNNFKIPSNSCGRLKTEESLGIISDLLTEDESWNLLDPFTDTVDTCLIDKSIEDIDAVFCPSKKSSESRTSFFANHVDSPIQNCLNAKYTSTPKNCFNNVIDLNKTVKLNDILTYDFLHDEMEPIIADSSRLKFKSDFDVAKFKENDILCSTSKLSLLPLPIQNPVLDGIPLVKGEEFAGSDKNADYKDVMKTYEVGKCKISDISNACDNIEQFENLYTECVVKNSDVLNTTYEIISDVPTAHVLTTVEDFSPHLVSESNQKCNGVINMNSTFVMPNNFEQIPEGDGTFIIESSPINIDKTISKKNILSTLFETSSENTSVFFEAKREDELSNTTCNKNFVNSKNTSKVLVENASSKFDREKDASSELNSTFCISIEAKNEKSTAHKDLKRRCSLPTISGKKGVNIQEVKLGINSLKGNMQKSTSLKLPITAKKKCLQSSISCPKGTSILKQSKNIKGNVQEICQTKKSFEIVSKIQPKKISQLESNSTIEKKTKQNKALVFRKSIGSLGMKDKDLSDSPFKNKANKKCVANRKSVSNLPTKVAPKISSNSKKMDDLGSKFTPNVTSKSSSSGCINLKSPLVEKFGKNKPRQSMLPTLHKTMTSTEDNASKTRNDVSCIINAVKSSFAFTNSKNTPASKNHQGNFENRRGIERKSMKLPSAENFENNLNGNYGKKIENFKSKLLKPGTLSRLPAPEKSIKPCSNLCTLEHSMKPNVIGHQRIHKRFSLQK